MPKTVISGIISADMYNDHEGPARKRSREDTGAGGTSASETLQWHDESASYNPYYELQSIRYQFQHQHHVQGMQQYHHPDTSFEFNTAVAAAATTIHQSIQQNGMSSSLHQRRFHNNNQIDFTSTATTNLPQIHPIYTPMAYYDAFLEKKLTIHIPGKNLVFYCRRGLDLSDFCENVARYLRKEYGEMLEREGLVYRLPNHREKMVGFEDGGRVLGVLFEYDRNLHVYVLPREGQPLIYTAASKKGTGAATEKAGDDGEDETESSREEAREGLGHVEEEREEQGQDDQRRRMEEYVYK